MSTRTYDKAPAGLPLMLKAALPAIPVVGALPGIKHERGGLPDVTLRRTRVATDLAHLDRYDEVCGFSRADTLPRGLPVRASELPKPRLKVVGKLRRPTASEIAANPRARSAILRVAERTHD